MRTSALTRGQRALRDEVLSGTYDRMRDIVQRVKNGPPERCRTERAWKRPRCIAPQRAWCGRMENMLEVKGAGALSQCLQLKVVALCLRLRVPVYSSRSRAYRRSTREGIGCCVVGYLDMPFARGELGDVCKMPYLPSDVL